MTETTDYMERYNAWLKDEFFSEEARAELAALEGNEAEIQDRFYKNLEFGTGGLRGKIGVGTNRMNIYTVGKATQGLANYVLKQNIENPSAAVSFDSRRMSREFAERVAQVLCANGIKVHIFDSIRPTPVLSFAVRYLNCTTGIMITASHNPPEDNGYKAYWSDGGQLAFPRDEEVTSEVEAILSFADIKTLTLEEAAEQGLYSIDRKSVV